MATLKLAAPAVIDFLRTNAGGATATQVAEKFGTKKPAASRLLADLREVGAVLVVSTLKGGGRGRPTFVYGAAETTVDVGVALAALHAARAAEVAAAPAPEAPVVVETPIDTMTQVGETVVSMEAPVAPALESDSTGFEF
jgi:IclR helix-turn-helix domain